jgi:hypothetical protein
MEAFFNILCSTLKIHYVAWQPYLNGGCSNTTWGNANKSVSRGGSLTFHVSMLRLVLRQKGLQESNVY